MGDHDDGAGEIQEEIFQPVDGFDVQVVGGFVQHHNVRIAEEGLGQEDLHLDAGVGIRHGVCMQLCGDAQTLENLTGVGLCLPAAQLCKFRLQFRSPEPVFVGEVGLFVKGVLLFPHPVQPLVAHDHRVQHRMGVVGELILLQDGHADAGLDGNGPGGGVQLPGEDPQEGGFSGAVGAYDAIAVPGGKLQVYPLEQPLAAKLHAKVVDCNHDVGVPFSWYVLESVI